jgi:hypothetical protein
MVIAHVLFGALIGFSAGLWSWMAGLSGWAALGAYILSGSLGTLVSVLLAVLRSSWTTAPRTGENAMWSTQTHEGCQSAGEGAARVAVEQHRRGPLVQGQLRR